jgi:3-hydroxyisobutyrate dehydrogenase
MTTRPTVAVLGVGLMGLPMSRRLRSAGFNVRVWNRNAQKAAPVVAEGATLASTPGEAAAGADFVLTMLPDGAAVESVMIGPDGVLSTLGSDATWLQMSSVGMEWAERLGHLVEGTAINFVDAPVSGSVGPAETGQLLILASGPSGVRDKATPLFDVLGRRTYWLGDAGAGSRAKLVLNNWLVDLVESVAETLRFTRALGLDPHTLVDILSDAPIGSPYAVAKARQMLAGEYAPSFALKTALKDADLALEAAGQLGTTLLLTDSFIDSWHRAVSQGLGDSDLSVVFDSAS